ncbi:MAG: YkgJ family cysteine cluster protein [Lachnospiraceae bacterium]|nr:YkgJ family cysteine cluster protein [Lachnospiraceae bacterium]
MEREMDWAEVSDGRFYRANDMVRVDCGGCAGCSECCRGMGESIVLDPFDIFRLCGGLHTDFDGLLQGSVELHVVDDLILPNLCMSGPEESCVFLSASGRCNVHAFRPGFCRMFPLGHCYEDGSFRYFLQVHECPKPDKGKVKVRKWIDTPDLKEYEAYITRWHYYLKDLTAEVREDSSRLKPVSMEMLQKFYVTPYRWDGDFYEQFYERFPDAYR